MKPLLIILGIELFKYARTACVSDIADEYTDLQAISEPAIKSDSQQNISENKSLTIDDVAFALNLHDDGYKMRHDELGAIDARLYDIPKEEHSNHGYGIEIHQYDINSEAWLRVESTGNMFFYQNEKMRAEFPDGFPYQAYKDGFAIRFVSRIHQGTLDIFNSFNIAQI